MSKPRHIVAIEIGSSKIKGAVGEVEPGGTLKVIAIEEEKQSPNFVRYGGVQNVSEVANVLNGLKQKLNNRLSAAASERVASVYVGVGGRSLMASQETISQNLPDDLEITTDIVDELMDQARSRVTNDRDVVDVEPGEFVVDNMSIATPVGTVGRSMSATVSVISIRAKMIRNLSLAINDKANLKINGFVPRQIALADMLLDANQRMGVMLVDCGAETTTVSIYKGGFLRYLNTIPLGGRHITRDVMAMNYSEERAEELKRSVGNANPLVPNPNARHLEGIDDAEINNYVSARAGEIVVNIAEQITYAGFTPADLPSGIVVVGGAASLCNFCEELSDFTHMEVRQGTLPAGIHPASGSRLRLVDHMDVVSLLVALSKDPDTVNCTVTREQPKLVVDTDTAGTVTSPTSPTSGSAPAGEDEGWGEPETPKRGWGFMHKIADAVVRIVTPTMEDDDEYDSDEDED